MYVVAPSPRYRRLPQVTGSLPAAPGVSFLPVFSSCPRLLTARSHFATSTGKFFDVPRPALHNFQMAPLEVHVGHVHGTTTETRTTQDDPYYQAWLLHSSPLAQSGSFAEHTAPPELSRTTASAFGAARAHTPKPHDGSKCGPTSDRATPRPPVCGVCLPPYSSRTRSVWHVLAKLSLKRTADTLALYREVIALGDGAWTAGGRPLPWEAVKRQDVRRFIHPGSLSFGNHLWLHHCAQVCVVPPAFDV